ncbi:PilZ domain-containing protein [Psychromonas antarctica]|uniref:PilZ domain-containing protein n=1 Tax=Psychromonas antarctica TaxID=67573 RepID=UPI001EE8D5B0|nr:PilZ domain-containing protein [Psychromonas antarctica]MCG6202469.1 PilZ domain-containing protein [Psychromonas antarctica]
MDFKNYQVQIKELISLRNEPDFNDLLDRILFGESNSDKFLIKMEINRLTKPCIRIIDLRHKMNEECQLFQHEKLSHYLTAGALKIYQDNHHLYGVYTIGVFEAVDSYIAQKKKKQAKKQLVVIPKKRQDQCDLLCISQRYEQGAPRMFFVSAVDILLADGKTIKGQTSNISISGVKIKFQQKVELLDGASLQIIFTDLQLEYQEAILTNEITYQLVKQADDGNTHYLYLSYADNKPQFIAFIRDFVRSNQHKYKIDVHYFYQLAKIKALNHTYLSQMSALPIYLDNRSASPFLFALKNSVNKKILNEWHCDGFNQLPMLFNELRLPQLLAHTKEKSSTTVYCFTYNTTNKTYFISASEEELVEKGLKKLFIDYGSSKKSWRVYHLTLNTYQYQQGHNYNITDPVPTVFERTTHIATLQPLFYTALSHNESSGNKELNEINQFVHHFQKESDVQIFTLFSSEQRKEPRYLYKSKLSLDNEGRNYTGEIIDFSLSGLKIKLDKITSIAVSTVVTINLFALQKVSQKHPLSHLGYKVIRYGPNNVLHLQVCDSKTFSICSHFFYLLVKNNPSHFKCLPLKTTPQPSSERLSEIAQEALYDCVFFIGKDAGLPNIKYAAIDKVDHPLHKLFSLHTDNHTELNYYPITNNQLHERLLSQPLKQDKAEGILKEALIYVKASKDRNDKWLINSFLDSDFHSEQEKIDFIIKANKKANFYALHYRLSSIKPVCLESIKPEIRTISRFAIHLTKKLEEELSTIHAIIEITDRTSDMMRNLEGR